MGMSLSAEKKIGKDYRNGPGKARSLRKIGGNTPTWLFLRGQNLVSEESEVEETSSVHAMSRKRAKMVFKNSKYSPIMENNEHDRDDEENDSDPSEENRKRKRPRSSGSSGSENDQEQLPHSKRHDQVNHSQTNKKDRELSSRQKRGTTDSSRSDRSFLNNSPQVKDATLNSGHCCLSGGKENARPGRIENPELILNKPRSFLRKSRVKIKGADPRFEELQERINTPDRRFLTDHIHFKMEILHENILHGIDCIRRSSSNDVKNQLKDSKISMVSENQSPGQSTPLPETILDGSPFRSTGRIYCVRKFSRSFATPRR
ncbi:uncharacterized protein [Fopius arisanus]|uniref:Uncharacterized protein isoform X1 n=1 Tax=Fopius arisanus TaxID=64838 RepID=A0A9R1SYY4_9HYME|nr:PREDICTED: uncharacterized protein LOC105264490 isoform X1 [Fopius arisanus]XP_011299693.1 PREDICTED: uncharacterized protein LOC105264490 isoform X1 [Fopius arisanus]